jgi:1-acyl-sn-glycerol-3-phosphate acyltransferase
VRYLIAPLRLVLLGLHIVAGLLILLVIFPPATQPRRNRIIRGWSRVLLAICGARLMVTGRPLDPALARSGMQEGTLGRLLVANHISWIDVFAIQAVTPGRFVAKSEIGSWPLLGAVVTRSGTLYIERGKRHAVASINRLAERHMKAGESIMIFPEGTTTDGTKLLPFHSNLFAPALQLGAPVGPIALRYTESGEPTTAVALIGDLPLLKSLLNIMTARDLQIEVMLLEELSTAEHPNRHELARAAHAAIAAQLQVPIEERVPAAVGA